MTRKARIVLLALLIAGCGNGGPKTNDRGSLSTRVTDVPNGSAREFVQAFYDWYVPLANAPASVDGYDSILTRRASSFSPSLLAELRNDIEAQKRAIGEIVGVTGDYDPFLNSQDP